MCPYFLPAQRGQINVFCVSRYSSTKQNVSHPFLQVCPNLLKWLSSALTLICLVKGDVSVQKSPLPCGMGREAHRILSIVLSTKLTTPPAPTKSPYIDWEERCCWVIVWNSKVSSVPFQLVLEEVVLPLVGSFCYLIAYQHISLFQHRENITLHSVTHSCNYLSNILAPLLGRALLYLLWEIRKKYKNFKLLRYLALCCH